MKTPYAISKTQRTMLAEAMAQTQQAQAALVALYRVILAGHDVTNGQVVDIDEESIWVETQDVESDPA